MTQQTDIPRQLARLKVRYATNLDARIDQLMTALGSLNAQADPGTCLQDILRQIHSLTGSAGTFGFGRISAHARQLELIIKAHVNQHTLPDTRSLDHLVHGLNKIRQLAHTGPDEQKPHEASPRSIMSAARAARRVYIVTSEPDTAQQLSRQLEAFDYNADTCSTSAEACSLLAQQTPDALIIDAVCATQEHSDDNLSTLMQQAQSTPVPVIFIAPAHDWTSRLAAVRAGGRACIDKPVVIEQLLEHLERISQAAPTEPRRVLVVDDSVELAQHYVLVLRNAGMFAEMLSEPEKILDTLQRFRPELVLLDYYFPGISGLEIAQVLRQHETWSSTPIVFLSTELEHDIQLSTLQQSDDFLEKPVLDEHLISAVVTRIERARALHRLMLHDRLTGLPGKGTLKQLLETEHARSTRQQQPLCYIMLRLDNFRQLNATHGYAAGDQALKTLADILSQRLRKSDQIGRISADTFGIIMPNTNASNARDVIKVLADGFSCQHQQAQLSCSFSASIACSASLGEDVQLSAAAASALQRAGDDAEKQLIICRQ